MADATRRPACTAETNTQMRTTTRKGEIFKKRRQKDGEASKKTASAGYMHSQRCTAVPRCAPELLLHAGVVHGTLFKAVSLRIAVLQHQMGST